MSGILVADLPKTFRDAVLVSRYLGIPYLWIDSICIIQGDTEDWAPANHASDSAGGCFHIRPARISASLTLPGIGHVHAQLCANSDEILYANAEFSDEPLTKRAWALQERLLAARVIHYNSGQMYFECRHGMLGEDGCKTDKPYCDLSHVMQNRSSARKALETWSSIIWKYSDRDLTNPTDKFPALSGIANLLGGLLKDEYVAGLWSSVMVQELAWLGLWRQNPQPINEYVGPGWSWASFQGTVVLNKKLNWRSIAIVEDWQIELTNPDDHYGQVKSASVRMRGPLTQLTKSMIPGGDHAERLKRAGVRPHPNFCTQYSGEGMDIKMLLLGGYGQASPVPPCEAERKEAESKQDKSDRNFKFKEGFGLVDFPIHHKL
ncbi:heterokaryon incompatibility protein [Fusarium circinatum]|uniref:Heterokaryon incompatibility protein n=1 Tax=Fusarium circinatum TaxID=48490 RepID=A0A8H5X6V5_FUSCI|nr:heterokaryon incompatibility protein [Fusarium circinatum]